MGDKTIRTYEWLRVLVEVVGNGVEQISLLWINVTS